MFEVLFVFWIQLFFRFCSVVWFLLSVFHFFFVSGFVSFVQFFFASFSFVLNVLAGCFFSFLGIVFCYIFEHT